MIIGEPNADSTEQLQPSRGVTIHQLKIHLVERVLSKPNYSLVYPPTCLVVHPTSGNGHIEQAWLTIVRM
jgi:hypothetical protein